MRKGFWFCAFFVYNPKELYKYTQCGKGEKHNENGFYKNKIRHLIWKTEYC